MPITERPQTAEEIHGLFLDELCKPSKLSRAINSKEVTEELERIADEYGE